MVVFRLSQSINFYQHIGFSMSGGEIQMNDGFDMEQYREELDRIIAEVMPEGHPVHERLAN